MQESVAPVFSCPACEGYRFVDSGQGSLCVALSFDLGKQTSVERDIHFPVVGVHRQCLSKVRRSGLAAIEPSACPSGLQRSHSCKVRNRILLAEFDDNFRVAPGSSSITANHFEVGLVGIGGDQGRYMTRFDRVGDGFFDERPRRSDLTEQPLCDGEVDPRDRAGIRAEAERGLTIPLGIVNSPMASLNSLAPR
jgi:hypothetical protein